MNQCCMKECLRLTQQDNDRRRWNEAATEQDMKMPSYVLPDSFICEYCQSTMFLDNKRIYRIGAIPDYTANSAPVIS